MSNSASSEAFPIPDIIPFFPLPSVVFLPFTYLPLHIFEPRYREMIKATVSNGDCIGMALLKEGWEDQYYGNPPIYELGCVGQLVNVKERPDGRYDIVLKGLRRCKYIEQTVSTSYRQAKVNLLSDPSESISLDPNIRKNLTQRAKTYLGLKQAHDLVKLITTEKIDDCVLVNSLSAGLDFTPVEKQFLLDADHLSQRARRLADLLNFKLTDLHSSPQG